MKEIVFPGFGIKINISNIAFEFGELRIYWYGLIIVFAILLAFLFMKKDDGKYGIKFEDFLYLSIFLIPVSFICARIYYVVFYFDYYKDNLINVINIRDGGLAIYGGVIGGIITTVVYCKIKKINVLDMLDYITPYLALGQAIGRWGNFFNVEAFGEQTNSIFRMGIMQNGIYTEVHPTFLYESVADLAIFILLFCIRNKRKFKGEITFLYLMLYSIARFFIEGLRTDSLMFYNFRISQIVSIIMFVISILYLALKKYSVLFRKKDEE